MGGVTGEAMAVGLVVGLCGGAGSGALVAGLCGRGDQWGYGGGAPWKVLPVRGGVVYEGAVSKARSFLGFLTFSLRCPFL